MGVTETKAPFLGQSIFSDHHKTPFANLGGTASEIWYSNAQRTAWGSITQENIEMKREQAPEQAATWEFINYIESLERSNHLWKVNMPSAKN